MFSEQPPAGCRNDYHTVAEEIEAIYQKQAQNQFRAFVCTNEYNSVLSALRFLRLMSYICISSF